MFTVNGMTHDEVDYAIQNAFGARLNNALSRRVMGQSELAQVTGIPRRKMAGICTGTRHPSMHDLCRISHALQVSLDWLVSGLERMEPYGQWSTAPMNAASAVPPISAWLPEESYE